MLKNQVLYLELPLSAQTAYAQLADVANTLELNRSIENLHGSFSQKKVRGVAYWYFAFRDLCGQLRQLYVGPDNEAVAGAVERARKLAGKPQAALAPLAKSAVVLGCTPALPKHVRAIRRLSDYGFFRASGELVGTYAFIALGNVLGVKWLAGGSTTDVDFAHAGRNISVALPANVKIDVPAALTTFEQGFIPLVRLGGGAGASYKLASDPEFQIDFLTSLHQGGDAPVVIANLNVGLQPLRFMEFSLESVTQAVLVDRNGSAVTVSIPAPERYAVHKLLIVGERPATMRTKANKDLQQAAALFDYLLTTQPDTLYAAWHNALNRGPNWRKRAIEGLIALQRIAPQLKLGDFLKTTPR